jgi:hypothetical protein
MAIRFVRLSKKVNYCDSCGFPIFEPVVVSKPSGGGKHKHYCHFCAIMFLHVDPSYYYNNERIPVDWEKFINFWRRFLAQYRLVEYT